MLNQSQDQKSQEEYYQNLFLTIQSKDDYYKFLTKFILNIKSESEHSLLATQEFIENWGNYFEEMN